MAESLKRKCGDRWLKIVCDLGDPDEAVWYCWDHDDQKSLTASPYTTRMLGRGGIKKAWRWVSEMEPTDGRFVNYAHQ